MFPSETKNDNYGIFCKKVYDELQGDEIEIPLLSCIKGKSFSKIFNAFRYLVFISGIMTRLLFCARKFDIVYFQYVWVHVFFASILFKFLKKRNKCIIINFHGEDLLNFVENPQRNLFKKIIQYADLIIFPSEYYKNWLTSKYTVDAAKLFVSASGGVDRKVFKYQGKKEHKNNICFCSRLVPHKGWKDFVDAVAIIKEKKIDIHTVMIGYGPDLESLKNKVKKEKLDSLITIKTGLSHNEIAIEYSNSDLFIFPTANITESLGLVALEAMSCGLPVCGTKIAALPEYIIDHKNGFLVDVHCPKQIAEKIEYYFSLSDSEKEIYVQNALKTAEMYEYHSVCSELKKKIIGM